MEYSELTTDILRDLYLNQNIFIEDIANMFNVSRKTVSRRIKKDKLAKPRSMTQKHIANRDCELYKINIEEFKELYLEKGYSLKELKNLYKCGTKTILRYIHENKIKKSLDLELAHRAKTYEKHWGVTHPSKNPEIMNKIINTQINNKTFSTNSSGQEEQVYHLLLTKFSAEDIERQYKSELYPFPCDFYIKSLDLYMEYNGSQYHYKEPFDKNNPEHIERLSRLLAKPHSKGYRRHNMIKVWIKKDPLKRETAKKNNLNYREFWSVKEIENWLENIK